MFSDQPLDPTPTPTPTPTSTLTLTSELEQIFRVLIPRLEPQLNPKRPEQLALVHEAAKAACEVIEVQAAGSGRLVVAHSSYP